MHSKWCFFALWVTSAWAFLPASQLRRELAATTLQSPLSCGLATRRRQCYLTPRTSLVTVCAGEKRGQQGWLEERLSIVSFEEVKLDATSLTTQCLARELFRELYYNPFKVLELTPDPAYYDPMPFR